MNFIRIQVSEDRILYLRYSSILLISVSNERYDIFLSVDNIFSGDPHISIEKKIYHSRVKRFNF